MTFRSLGRDTLAMIGPRSAAVGAPQEMGKRALPAGCGWEVRRICSVRLEPVIVRLGKTMVVQSTSPKTRGVGFDSSLVGDHDSLNIQLGRRRGNDTALPPLSCAARLGYSFWTCAHSREIPFPCIALFVPRGVVLPFVNYSAIACAALAMTSGGVA